MGQGIDGAFRRDAASSWCICITQDNIICFSETWLHLIHNSYLFVLHAAFFLKIREEINRMLQEFS